MRKGKSYHYLHPTCLAPDMWRYGGLPRFVTADLSLLFPNPLTFHSDAKDSFVEIDPKTWAVTYHFQSSAGLFTCDWNLKVLVRSDGPGVRLVGGGVLNDGSTWAIQTTFQWNPFNSFQFGFIGADHPYEAEFYDGIIRGSGAWAINYVPYHAEP